MELNKKIVDEDELEDLLVKSVKIPNCANCIHNEKGHCDYFNGEITQLKNTDIFNCEFHQTEKDKVSKMLGVDM